MSIFFSKHKKLILSSLLILLISSLAIFVLGVGEAQAEGIVSQVLGFIGGKALDFTFEGIAWIIAKIGAIIHSIVSLFFWLAAMLLEIAFGLEKFTEAGVVQMGWKITRDLANMFFVLILMVIAFATILRIETYGMKQILWKLIVAALLINFSLVLAGVIIDFTQILTHFFYDQVKESTGVSAQIAGILNIQRVPAMNPDAQAAQRLAAGLAGVVMMIFSIFLGIILILVASLALGLGAFFLIVRLIMLWILLILAPLAWLLWILPATSHLFRQWWNTFLKWAFFAPIYAFFIYLAIKAAEGGSFTSIIQAEMENIVNTAGWGTLWSMIMATPSLFLQFLVIIGLLLGGLIAAQKMGVYGAQGTMGLVKGVGDRVAKWPARRAQMAAVGPAGAIGRGLGKAGEAIGRSRIGRWTGLSYLTKQAARGPRGFVEAQRKQLSESKKKYGSWTAENLDAEEKVASPQAKAAITAVKAERGHLKGDYKGNEERLKIFERMGGNLNDIFERRPDWLGQYEMNVKGASSQQAADKLQEAVNKLTPAKTGNIQAESFKDSAVQEAFVKALEPDGPLEVTHLSSIMTKNPQAAREMNINIFGSTEYRNRIKKEVNDWRKTAPGSVIFYTSPTAPT